jgi:hypothetical protein
VSASEAVDDDYFLALLYEEQQQVYDLRASAR